ncbi:biliverdin-producing heme oxygenase [Phytohabitans flavus]|uniref:Biliverdin-producing heme oxygenase n=1 Tax=Phytohabitans flavus TaxID=1076124 RepID=A0A6F8Y489_9ACTN|nr:biliverdin-producing heme oxygenase [Phytohabitans flavus]BCB80915.1 biliverdin-producing heme oxygenase [Phytohabitans flavus]
MGFASRVREVTRSDHAAAEGMAYFDALLSGRLDRAGYTALTVQLFFVYETLEEAATEMRADPVAGPFVADELARLPALVADLTYLIGTDWPAHAAASAPTSEYRARLRDVAFTWPAGFVAHHYTRYLGDLSGGQMMRRTIQREYGLDGPGTRFYEFPGLEPRAFKQNYRHLLDTAPWDAVEQERFLDEVALAYRLNTAMLDDLGKVVA